MTWQLSILDLTLVGAGHVVDLSAIRSCRELWSLIAEATDANLEDEELAELVRTLAKLLPASELVHRPGRLDPETIQVIVLANACKDRPKRRVHREQYLVEEVRP